MTRAMPTGIPTLHTERLTLRPFTAADGPRVQLLAGDRAIADTTAHIAHPYEDGMAEKWIAGHQPKFEAGAGLYLAVTLRTTSELLGAVGLTMDPPHRRAELGYWLGTPYWGQGYATEASETMIRYGFTELDLVRIVAHHMRRNPASQRILEKLGMQLEGVFRRHFLKWDKLEDIAFHGLLREEWEAAQL